MKLKKILLILLSLFILCSCTKNKEKAEITSTDFTEIATNNNFEVKDNIDYYKKSSYITEAILAKLDDIDIEMIKYDTEENAIKVQEEQIKQFNNLKSTGAPETKDKGKNYYKYELISNNYYMVSSRINNYLIFCKTSLTNSDKVKSILESLDF